MTATDFPIVEVCTLKGLVTYYILFFIDIASRSVHVAGITPHPAATAVSGIAKIIGHKILRTVLFFNGNDARSRQPMSLPPVHDGLG